MAEPIQPAGMPEQYKPRMPDPPLTVRTMDGFMRAYTISQAIRVDRNGGVWFDLNTPVVQGLPQVPTDYRGKHLILAERFRRSGVPLLYG
jgi:hypothetical protein